MNLILFDRAYPARWDHLPVLEHQTLGNHEVGNTIRLWLDQQAFYIAYMLIVQAHDVRAFLQRDGIRGNILLRLGRRPIGVEQPIGWVANSVARWIPVIGGSIVGIIPCRAIAGSIIHPDILPFLERW